MSDEKNYWESIKPFLILLTILALIVIGIFAIKPFIKPRPLYPTITYNQFEFTQKNNVWYTEWQKDGQTYELGIRYNPLEVENVSVSGKLNETFNRQPLYITFDPEQKEGDYKYLALAIAEFGLPAVKAMGAGIQSACTQNTSEACEAHAIVTCDDDDKSVMYLRIANETRVLLDGNCLVVEGNGLNLIKAIDRVLYHFLKIMP
jgi:hypothetical protein